MPLGRQPLMLARACKALRLRPTRGHSTPALQGGRPSFSGRPRGGRPAAAAAAASGAGAAQARLDGLAWLAFAAGRPRPAGR